MKKIPIDDALHMVANDFEYYHLAESASHVLDGWRRYIGDASGLVEVDGEVFLLVDEDCSFVLDEYPDADEAEEVVADDK